MAAPLTDEFPPLDPGLMPRDAVIAIDGPAGSGKSTTARALAETFGLLYIDTGAMYRALTQAALGAGISPGDENALVDLLVQARLELKPAKGEVTVFWNGKDVSRAIRTPEVESSVSLVSSHPSVRRNMVERQQAIGRRGGVVMEGRDIGSVVFPLATAKIFLSASLAARVERRFKQYQQRGLQVSVEDLRQDLAERDRQDSERETSPLMVSPDAIVIDSSDLNLEQQNEVCARACLLNPSLDRDIDNDMETARLELPWHYRLAYTMFTSVARFYGLRQVGNEGGALPRGCIVAVNHVSNWDPPLIGSTFWRHPVHTLAKAELFKIPPMGAFFRWIDSIPIQRRGYDATAFSNAAEHLADGSNLLIFPEGTRRAIGHPGPVRNGLGILVQATRAPTLPIFIRGSYGRRPGGSHQSPLEVHYGPIIRWHGLPALLETLDKKEVSRRIGHLCEAAFRELQARSFAEKPQTAFERELGAKQVKKFAIRQQQVFGG
ncbi:MAG: (d)CMP kinase [Candidatus Krumholzibacteriota bacterium]